MFMCVNVCVSSSSIEFFGFYADFVHVCVFGFFRLISKYLKDWYVCVPCLSLLLSFDAPIRGRIGYRFY